MGKIDTLLFDCDNTLVASEDLAFSGCADIVNEIIATHKLPLQPFDGESLQRAYVGQNFRTLLATLGKQYGLVLSPEEVDELVKREEDALIARFERELVACDGANAALERIAKQGYTLAVVSSSALRRVQVSLRKTGQDGYFGDRVYSAANSLPVPTSKPDPAIYLFSMQQLGKTPQTCVAIEDSRSGTLSAVAAGIPTIAYVGAYPPHERDEMAKALCDAGAKVVMKHWDDLEATIEAISKA